MKVIILFIGLISLINSSKRLLQKASCGDNEEYNRCGTACPSICGDSGSKICTRQCVAGCFCLPGFILDEQDGNCIPVNECPTDSSICGDNEVYKTCGTACPGKCGDSGPQICTKQCVEGCFCQIGFILDYEDGNCIPVNECPTNYNTPTCGVNEEYKICGTACPEKCGDSGSSTICTKQCVAGCFCKSGYKLDDVGKNCIPEDECPTEQGIFI